MLKGNHGFSISTDIHSIYVDLVEGISSCPNAVELMGGLPAAGDWFSLESHGVCLGIVRQKTYIQVYIQILRGKSVQLVVHV